MEHTQALSDHETHRDIQRTGTCRCIYMNKLCLCNVFQRIWALMCQINILWEANMSVEHVCVCICLFVCTCVCGKVKVEGTLAGC